MFLWIYKSSDAIVDEPLIMYTYAVLYNSSDKDFLMNGLNMSFAFILFLIGFTSIGYDVKLRLRIWHYKRSKKRRAKMK